MNRRIVLKTDAQMKAALLCRDCEQLFNRNGENYVLPLLNDDHGNFPLLNRLRLAIPFQVSPHLGFEAYSCDSVGFDSGKLAYFALSVLWRAAARTWLFLGQVSTSIDLEENEEPIRKYLLGRRGFPSGVAIHTTICTDFGSQGMSFGPAVVDHPQHKMFSILARGLYFRVAVGERSAAELNSICCVNGPKKPVFLASAEDKLIHSFGQLHETARVAQNMNP
ncbi:MAG TPA: hypothetical protein VMT20_14000 [Terriglobia bacterium]|nr:hypothetical protein [Terriglobia bacterium]